MSPREEAEFGLPEDASLERFAAELAALLPRARLDRDRLMYLAGQASVAPARVHLPRRWPWPAAFGGMTAVAASLLLLLALRPAPQVVERIVRVPMPVSPPNTTDVHPRAAPSAAVPIAAEQPAAARRLPPDAPAPVYLDLRDRVLAMGLDSFSPPGAPSDERPDSQPANYRDLLNSLLRDG
ncbi:MAG: hypothetical protein ACREHD_35030 [Pirellulales bacterium]